MVGSHDLGMNAGVLHAGAQGAGNEKVIDAPSHIPGPSPEPISPPGIIASLGIEFAESIDEAVLDVLVEGGPLFHGETGVAGVGFRVGQIDLLMSHVKIAACDNGFWFSPVA